MKTAVLKRTSRERTVTRGDTRDALLTAASDLMIEKDSIEFSLIEIGQRSGMSAALVQYHFGSKEGLMLALIERGVARATQQLSELALRQIPAVEKLKLHLNGLVNAYIRMPWTNRLLHVLMQPDNEQRAREVSELYITPVVEFYRTLLTQGVEEGSFRTVEPIYFYFVVIGACEHLAARRSVMRYAFDIQDITDGLRRDYVHFVYDIVIGGIGMRTD